LGEIIIIKKKTRIMKSIAFTSSILMASLLSPVKALEITNELTTEQAYRVYDPAFGTGPLLNGPTSKDPLSYHGAPIARTQYVVYNYPRNLSI
jgi:hypothetical protein